MAASILSRAGRRTRAGWHRQRRSPLWALPLSCVALLVTVGSPAGYAAVPRTPALGHSAPACPGRVNAGEVLAEVPWPQQRYDLAVMSQITQGAGVTVAVIDSGVDAAHPQLSTAVSAGVDMLDPAGDGQVDCIGHGTAVASLIAGRPIAGTGLRGIAPGVRILPIRVSERIETGTGAIGDGNASQLVAGIRAAIASRPRPAVINLSISMVTDHHGLRAAINAALAADIVVVAAVGNRHDEGNPVPYPASYDGVVAVGAIGSDGLRLPSSQTGAYVDLVAPGDEIVGASPRHGHERYQGTSFAAPFVTATAALIRAHHPELSQEEVVKRLVATADPAPGARPSPEYGYGILNPVRALTEITAVARAQPDREDTVELLTSRPAIADLSVGAVMAAAIMIVLTIAIMCVAAALGPGQRRSWRPGHEPSSPLECGD